MIKEFIAVWQDPRSRMALFVPPLIQFFVFAFAATLDVNNISIGIRNHDLGPYSREFIHRIEGSPFFTKILMLDSDEAMREAIDTQEVLVAVEIKEDFSRKLLSHQRSEILMIADGRKSNAAQITLGYINEIALRFNSYICSRELQPLSKTELRPINWYNPNLYYPWFTVTGLIGTLSMLTSLSVTALSIAREKEMGTFAQLLVSPLSPWLILIGKALPALVIGVLEGTMMLLAGVIFLDLPVRGNLLLFYPSMVVFIFSIVGIGLFISSISTTQQQSVLGVFICVSPIVILSGFATPIENMPQWLQYVSMLNPLRFFLVIARGVCFKDIPPIIIFNNTWPMLLIALGTLGTASWFFRRRVG